MDNNGWIMDVHDFFHANQQVLKLSCQPVQGYQNNYISYRNRKKALFILGTCTAPSPSHFLTKWVSSPWWRREQTLLALLQVVADLTIWMRGSLDEHKVGKSWSKFRRKRSLTSLEFNMGSMESPISKQLYDSATLSTLKIPISS